MPGSKHFSSGPSIKECLMRMFNITRANTFFASNEKHLLRILFYQQRIHFGPFPPTSQKDHPIWISRRIRVKRGGCEDEVGKSTLIHGVLLKIKQFLSRREKIFFKSVEYNLHLQCYISTYDLMRICPKKSTPLTTTPGKAANSRSRKNSKDSGPGLVARESPQWERTIKQVPSYQEKEFQGEGSPYHWSLTEEKRYINFLAERKEAFLLSPNDKRIKGIHSKMSKFIPSRNSKQCRSHHQKMLLKYGSVDHILEGMKPFIYKKNILKLFGQSEPLPLEKESQPLAEEKERESTQENKLETELESLEVEPFEFERVGFLDHEEVGFFEGDIFEFNNFNSVLEGPIRFFGFEDSPFEQEENFFTY